MPFGSLYQEFFQIWTIPNFIKENLEFFLKKGQKFVVWVEAIES
jgi:hypothetical protein